MTNVLKRPQAKGSIFKPEVDFFIFFPSVNRLEFVYATVSGSESAYVPSTNDS